MIQTNDIFIAIPRSYNTQVKVEISGVDETSKVLDSSWVKPTLSGIGTFKIILKNAFGRVSGKYDKGDIVKFFYDNTNATTLQFQGRIDKASEKMGINGQFLEIKGRHRSFLLTTTKVNYSAVNADPADILKAIIAQLPSTYGFTTTNVENVGKTMSKEWNYIDFWDCVKDLCEFSKFVCRVDNDLDFHFHSRTSKFNEDEHIVEGINQLKTSDFGIDDFKEVTRVIATGQTDVGQPIIYTAKSSTEGEEIREFVIRSVSDNTKEKVKNTAEAKLAELTNRPPNARFTSKPLETLEAGQNLWIVVLRQEIYGIFMALQVIQKFGSRQGGVRTETLIERESVTMANLMEERIATEDREGAAINVNKLDFTFNFPFDNDDFTASHKQTIVSNGFLGLANAGFNDGEWISTIETASKNITKVELRFVGKDLSSSKFFFSVDGGINWEEFTGQKELHVPVNTGKNLRAKIELVKNSFNPQPEVNDSLILFS